MTREEYLKYADENGLSVGKNLEKLLLSLEASNQYCPCKFGLWTKQRPNELEKIICPCDDHMKEIEEAGHCHCGLFWKKQS